jgi:Fe-S-cluster containining protein
MSESLKVVQEEPWYAEGLRFQCTECGKCCTGAPGYVWVSEEEIQNIADLLQITPTQVRQKYLRNVGNRLALLEDKKNYDCIFLRDKKCTIYLSRPKQCRTFPWWKENLRSREAWEEAARYCEGIRSEAPLVPFSTIQEQLSAPGTEG